MSQAEKRDMSHLAIENGLLATCNISALPLLSLFVTVSSSSRAPGPVDERQKIKSDYAW
ncbi:uncharacterized protein BDW43DRAFT_285499 [Aspergillus alliaceus]|uniref:uncharacterized protein n=1 Tax=Petromyces alliaceus TaxID=209559 RepID=UPI0012A5EFA4|nr:uncharacterized protein BDW43DRAFT_285499 [Aspergillus alliaceus]KAB8230470.1 hypothetical protein BDW43DRAFT_285499 [Aspergillus alliaceus]